MTEPINTMFGPMCRECRTNRPREDGLCYDCAWAVENDEL